MHQLPTCLVGDDAVVPLVDGTYAGYLNLDCAASTPPLPAVLERVQDAAHSYSAVHRGAGYKSMIATGAYEEARRAVLAFAGRDPDRDLAVFCRNTTDAINHAAYRLRLTTDDVVVTTEAEHHANLLPWARYCRRRVVPCDADGTFTVAAVGAALDVTPRPRLLAVTGASNVTGWLPPLNEIIEVAHERRVPVLVDAAQLAPHHPLPSAADFVAWSAHKMYAPFGAGVLIGPRNVFAAGDPFLHGGGAVDLVNLEEVLWANGPDREEAGSPNVLGTVALHAAIETLSEIGFGQIERHERALATKLRPGLASIAGVHLMGPDLGTETLAVAAFTIDGMHHALVAARLSAEYGIGVRHGCFCAHPLVLRLLGVDKAEVHRHREAIRRHDKSAVPGAVRASAGLSTTHDEIDRFLSAIEDLANGKPPATDYTQNAFTGDYAVRS